VSSVCFTKRSQLQAGPRDLMVDKVELGQAVKQ